MRCRMGPNDVPAWAIFPFDQQKKVSLLPLDRKGKLQMKTKDFLSRYLSLGWSVSFVALAFFATESKGLFFKLEAVMRY